MHVGFAAPDRLLAPVGRSSERLARNVGRIRIADRERDLARRVSHRVENRQIVRAQLGRAVEKAVGVDAWITLIGGDLVVEIRLGIGPIPFCDDDVALDTLRPRGRGRQLTGFDAISPIGEHRQGALLAELPDAADHVAARLPGADAAVPGERGGIESPESLGDLARRLAAELVTGPAAIGLHQTQPLRLALHVRINAIALRSGSGEFVLLRNLDQGIPIIGGIVFRRRARVRRHDRRQI